MLSCSVGSLQGEAQEANDGAAETSKSKEKHQSQGDEKVQT